MKTRNFAGIIILLLSVSAFGQQNFASISFGACLPQGDYGLAEDISSSGYAKPGGAIKFDGAFFPGSYLGIGGSFSFGSNYGMSDSLLTDMLDYIVDNAPSLPEIPEEADKLYGNGFWNNVSLFIGPHFSIRATQKLYFDIRVLGGLTILRPPDQELLISWDGNEIHSRVSNQKVTFGFSAGGGLRYKLNEDLALKLAVDFNQARAKFDYTFALFQGIDVPPVAADFFVRTVDIMVGLAYAF